MLRVKTDRRAEAHANAQANRLLMEDRAFHDWYRFVLSFPPHLVRDYLDRFGVTEDQCVLDRFRASAPPLCTLAPAPQPPWHTPRRKERAQQSLRADAIERRFARREATRNSAHAAPKRGLREAPAQG
jgi:Zn-dependent peptidase ImmA (M78 family)